LTQIKGLYRIINAIKQTYTIVRNSTKLIAACIVLGVVTQACAIGTVTKPSRADVPSQADTQAATRFARAESALAVSTPLRLPAAESVTIATDPMMKVSPEASAAQAAAPIKAATAEAPVAKPSSAPRTSGYAGTAQQGALPKGASRPVVIAQAEPAAHSLPTPRPSVEASIAAPITQTATAVSSSPASIQPRQATSTSIPAIANSAVTAAVPASRSSAEAPAVADSTGTPQTPASQSATQVISAAPVAMQAPAPVPIVYSDTPKEIPPGSLWDRIRSGYAMPAVESPLVQRHMTWYLNRPEYLERMVERSRRYLHFVVEELERRGMPLEIALLPMIESAYNPVAYSSAHASGIWQFIPATGRRYGLEQNWWYDGRRDVTAATNAALDYLQKLHGDFGDWQLALAAYNWGEGAVGRAIEKNQRKHKPTDYRSLTMPKETAHYLPKLQAVKNLIADPARYGVVLDEIPDQPYFIRVNAPSHIDVKRAAQLAEVPLEEFRNLNPAHNRPMISSNGERMLLLPVEKAGIFATNLEANADPLVSWQTVTLKQNERLEKVAARYGISVNTLKQVNSINSRQLIRPGQTLIVPTPAAMQKNANLERTLDPLEFRRPSAGPDMEVYRVKRGDTLQRIANQHRVTKRQIVRWNYLKNGRISVGQQLTVYPDTAPVPTVRAAKTKMAKTAKAAAQPVKAKPAVGTRRKQVARN